VSSALRVCRGAKTQKLQTTAAIHLKHGHSSIVLGLVKRWSAMYLHPFLRHGRRRIPQSEKVPAKT
jgi:hypothetical protein